MQRNLRVILSIAWICSLLVAGRYAYHYMSQRNQLTTTEHAKALDQTQKTALHVEQLIKAVEDNVRAISTALASTNDSALEKAVRTKPVAITGIGIVTTWATDATPTAGVYFAEKDGQQQLINFAQTEAPASAAPFFTTIRTQNASYHGPIKDPYTERSSIVYAATITTASGATITVFATLSLDHIQHVLSTLYAGKNGYWFATDDQGKIIIHPRSLFTTSTTTLNDIARETGASELTTVIQHDEGELTYNNEVTQQSSWLMYKKIAPVNWKLCGVFELDEVSLPNTIERHDIMLIALSLFISFLLFMGIITITIASARAHHWILSALTSCACLLTIAALWYAAGTYPDVWPSAVPVDSKVSLYSFLNTLEKGPDTASATSTDTTLDSFLTYRYKKGRYIPTGVFIHYMQFVSESQVNIVGYVWQRYFDGTHDGLLRGFVLPQATGDATITEVFRSKVERQETIIWRVNATLNQEFSYTKYPFDGREIKVQLWHADFGKNILLVPDLDSYAVLTASSLPGLSSNAYLPNWKFNGSYFGYQKYLYNSVFGLYAYGPFGIYERSDKSYKPELHFVATAQRLLIDTLIDDLFPLFLIALLLFVIFITDLGHGYAVFAAYASVFFGIVVSQLHFRSKIPSNQLVYFENLYFIMYATLMAAAIFTVIKLRGQDHHSSDVKKGKVAEFFYWPVLLTAIIIVTVAYLY